MRYAGDLNEFPRIWKRGIDAAIITLVRLYGPLVLRSEFNGVCNRGGLRVLFLFRIPDRTKTNQLFVESTAVIQHEILFTGTLYYKCNFISININDRFHIKNIELYGKLVLR